MLALRLVLDTNIVVSGALSPDGLERTALVFALTPPARLYVSHEILLEYERVLGKPRLKLSPLLARQLMDLINGRAKLVSPARPLLVSPDPGDNKFLECAEAARADYLVTGNKRHFPRHWRNTKVIHSRELMEVIAPHLRP